VVDQRKPQPCLALNRAYGLPANDRHERDQLLCSPDLRTSPPHPRARHGILIIPTSQANLGLNSTESGLFATGIYGIVKMAACATFLIFVADSLGRRMSLLWTAIAQGAAMFYIGFYVRLDPPVKDQAVPPAGYVAIVMIFLFASFFQFGWGPVCWIYVSEIPSARLRAMNVAFAAATQWLFNFVVARATPVMIVTVGNAGYGTYFIYGSFCFAMWLFAYLWVPETKGISLEDMDGLFGVIENKYIDDEGGATARQMTTIEEDSKDVSTTVYRKD
jgi:hypothetical protein